MMELIWRGAVKLRAFGGSCHNIGRQFIVQTSILTSGTLKAREASMLRAWAALFAAAFLSTVAAPNLCAEEGYPSRSIRLVVGFGPGGATDTFGRLLAATLSQQIGQTVFVENVSGASGYIAWQRVASSPPDGYTLMMAENALVMRPGFKDRNA
jgi:tripartite tricarboxylate transporter family receptor